MTLIIRHRDELSKLLSTHETRVRFEIVGLSDQANAVLQERLGRLYSACGCAEAAAGLLLGLFVAVIGGVWMSMQWWRIALLALVLGVITSAVTKLAAQRLARWRLRRAVAAELSPPG